MAPPPAVNPQARVIAPRRATPAELWERIRHGDRVALAQGITLVESLRPADRELARKLVSLCAPLAGRAWRIGITGVPGVGKSTFLEALGMHLCADPARRIAILAIDPSSELTGGSILGDKSRMERLTRTEQAFIRPSPTRGTLGGVSRWTREVLILCEAAGYDPIFVETVGVGQSEIGVERLVDSVLVLMLTGAGDALQGIKRGLMEIGDVFAVTKADGSNLDRAQVTAQSLRGSLALMPPRRCRMPDESMVRICSAAETTGIAEVWESLQKHREVCEFLGELHKKRVAQAQEWLREDVTESIGTRVAAHPVVRARLKAAEELLLEGKLPPLLAQWVVEGFPWEKLEG